jgi:Domain of unknown function (DUF4383)
MSTARRMTAQSGVGLLIIGVLGLLFARSSLLFGILPINTLLETLYIISGLWLIIASSDDQQMCRVIRIMGPVYGVLGILGLIFPSFDVFGLVPIHGLTAALFVAFALLLVADWLALPTRIRVRHG